jgi:hypothetical protein
MPVYIEYQFNKWVMGNLESKEKEDIEKIFQPYKNTGMVIVTSFSLGKYSYSDFSNDFIQFSKINIKNLLSSYGKIVSFFVTNSNYMTTLIVND